MGADVCIGLANGGGEGQCEADEENSLCVKRTEGWGLSVGIDTSSLRCFYSTGLISITSKHAMPALKFKSPPHTALVPVG